MAGLLGVANLLSIGAPKDRSGRLVGMPTMTLAERALLVRKRAGYGDKRQASAFAKKMGISAPSLHDIESGKTLDLGAKSLVGYYRVGANLEFLLREKGQPMLSKFERRMEAEELTGIIMELDAEKVALVKALLKQLSGKNGVDGDGSDDAGPSRTND
ncbi:MAG: hypothetical protein ACREDY_06455 [Bradyrhizobium sp.]